MYHRCIRNETKGKGGGNLLNYAARGGSTKLAELLIEKGVSVNPEDYEVGVPVSVYVGVF